jgi:hypothetical protein
MVLRDTYDDIDDYFSLFCHGLYSIVSWNESNVWTCYTMNRPDAWAKQLSKLFIKIHGFSLITHSSLHMVITIYISHRPPILLF